MIDLSRHIEYLLLEKNEVTVPSLGTFHTAYESSRWIEEENLFLPPYRSVSFTKENIFECDKTFAKSLSSLYNITAQEADILCTEFTENIRQELRENGSADLGSIGSMIQEAETEEILFVPCQAGVASPTLYGLDALSISPLADGSKKGTATDNKKKQGSPLIEKDEKNITIRINRRFVNYVSAFAASILLFFAIANPARHKTENTKAETPIFIGTPQKVQQEETPIVTVEPEKVEAPAPEEVQAEEPIAIEENIQTVIAETSTEPATTEQISATKEVEYAIVVASAVSLKNAERYTKELNERGLNACIQTGEKMNRVIIPGFKSMEEVHSKLSEMREKSKEFDNAWALKLD